MWLNDNGGGLGGLWCLGIRTHVIVNSPLAVGALVDLQCHNGPSRSALCATWAI